MSTVAHSFPVLLWKSYDDKKKTYIGYVQHKNKEEIIVAIRKYTERQVYAVIFRLNNTIPVEYVGCAPAMLKTAKEHAQKIFNEFCVLNEYYHKIISNS